MSDDFLSRWSRRKIEARKGQDVVPAPGVIPASDVIPANGTQAEAQETPPSPLPPVESLTPESDFTPFMKSEVDPSLRRAALKTLFQDPRFNVMDGLDVYIDDYSKADPLPEGWLEKLNVMAYLGDNAPAPAETPQDAPKTPQLAQEPATKQEVAVAPEPHIGAAPAPESPSSECKDSSPPGPG